jgi:hypothetical protein
MKSLRKSTALSVLAPPCLAATVLILAAAPSRAVDYPTTILNDHPSAYYRFEELPGSTAAVDSSVNANSAAYNFNTAGSPVLGEPGIDTNSILFTGAGPGGAGDYGYVDIPASTLITPLAPDGIHSGPFSAELWVKPTVQPSDYEVPLEVAQWPDGWNFYISPGPGASYFIVNMPNGVFFSSFGSAIQFLQWYHLVLTYDGTNETFYINGVSTGTYPAALVPAVGADATVGSGQYVYSNPTFSGGIDEVAFYTNVLSSAQVANHYAVGTNSFRAPPTGAEIVTDLTDETNYSGLPATFSVLASGTAPLTYYWLSNSVPVGPNANSLTFTAQYPGNNNASVQVIVSNSYGQPATSSVVTLTVLTNVNLVSPPGSIARNVGSHAAFHVTANGAVPITYQWSVSTDGGNTFTSIPGATNQTYWLSSVQMPQNNNQYSVMVKNPFTSASAAATLTVQARTDPAVPLTGYGAIVAADEPVAYWRLDEANGATTAIDAVGTFDGTYTPGSAGTITYGVTTGIPKSTDPAVTLANGASIQIPFAPELNPDTAWTAETWISPSSLGADGGDYRVVLSSEYNVWPNPYNGWYIYQGPGNTFILAPQPGNDWLVAGPDDPPNNNLIVVGKWYHLVVSDDLINFNVYINGELRTSYPAAGLDFIPNGDGINADGTAGITSGYGNTVLGERTDGAYGTFEGTMDDTAFYNYALSPQQVFEHYVDATLITITASGTNVILTWPVGVLQKAASAAGPFADVAGATSPTTNAVGKASFWRVRVP